MTNTRFAINKILKTVIAISVMAVLSACNVETVTSAATVAAAKKQEIEQGKKGEEKIRQDTAAALEQGEQRNHEADDK